MSTVDDLSYKQIASQLHTFPGVSYDAGNAVDRDLSTCMRTREIGFNSSYKTVWWKVDFGGVYNIYSINEQIPMFTSTNKMIHETDISINWISKNMLLDLFLSSRWF